MSSLRRFVPLLAVGLLLLGAALAALLATPQIRPVQPPRPNLPTLEPTDFKTVPPVAPAGQGAPTTPDHPVGIQVPEWLLGIAQGLCVLAFLGVVGLVIWLLVRNGLRPKERKLTEVAAPSQQTAREHVIAAVDAGLSDLDDSDADPRRAVIACWVRLEQAAAAAGTPRAPGDTPTDLVGRLLAEQHVSAAVLYPLAEVYRLARYATHTVDTAMRDDARAALGQLRAELSRPTVRQGAS
jgi:Domain of unknown function (DUF4129)